MNDLLLIFINSIFIGMIIYMISGIVKRDLIVFLHISNFKQFKGYQAIIISLCGVVIFSIFPMGTLLFHKGTHGLSNSTLLIISTIGGFF